MIPERKFKNKKAKRCKTLNNPLVCFWTLWPSLVVDITPWWHSNFAHFLGKLRRYKWIRVPKMYCQATISGKSLTVAQYSTSRMTRCINFCLCSKIRIIRKAIRHPHCGCFRIFFVRDFGAHKSVGGQLCSNKTLCNGHLHWVINMHNYVLTLYWLSPNISKMNSTHHQ